MKQQIRVGLALTGSFCTFSRILRVIETMIAEKRYEITPILSENAGQTDTRFGEAAALREILTSLTGHEIIDSIPAAEPIGPKGYFDVLAVAPCTGNTLAKLAHGITDTTVTMAVKSHLRVERPVVLALSSNDALSGNAANLGQLLVRRGYYFVPMGQDAPYSKPRSIVADMERLPLAIDAALEGKQLQPILFGPSGA